MQKFGFYTALSCLAVLSVYVTFSQFVEFSAFALGIGKTALVVIIFSLFDKFVLHEIDTISELKKGNVAYAVFLLALAIVLHGAFAGV